MAGPRLTATRPLGTPLARRASSTRCASATRASVAAAFADAGITAIVTDTVINEGFESLTGVLAGLLVNFVVLRPPVAVLRQRGIDRLPEEAAYLADRYGDSDHPEAALFASRVQAAAGGSPVNEFEGIIERGLDRLPHIGLWVDPSGLSPQSVVGSSA